MTHEKKQEYFVSDSVREHLMKMLEAGSSASEFRMNFQKQSLDGIEDVHVVMFLVRDPKIVDAFRAVLAKL